MTIKISVPISDIRSAKGRAVVLESGGSCSRCNRSPAGYYEVHSIEYLADPKPLRVVGKKFGETWKYSLKLALCEACYKSDFLTHPELMDSNGSDLARISWFHTILRTLGGLLAAGGFILFTPLIAVNGLLGPVKQYWQIPVAAGVLLLLLAWMDQHKHQTRIRQELTAYSPDFAKRSRAIIKVNIIKAPSKPGDTGIEIFLQNEPWAEDAAKARHWAFEKCDEDPTLIIPES